MVCMTEIKGVGPATLPDRSDRQDMTGARWIRGETMEEGWTGPSKTPDRSYTRRQVLQAAVAVGAGVGLSPLLAACGGTPGTGATPSATSSAALSEADARDIGIDAYVYGYPLVTMEYTRRVMTNVAKPGPVGGMNDAPMGQFALVRSYPTADFKAVTSPNADTYYTILWLDVAKEPWIVTQPDMHDRYFMMPMLDGWTTVFAAPGSRTTGTGAQKYGITGPGWKGTLPEGVTEYKSPTSIVWMIGRIYCTGTPQDSDVVHKLQDQFSAVPLSSYGTSYTPPAGKVDPNVDMTTPVRDQVNALSAEGFFTLLAELMKTNPPVKEDKSMVAKLASIGIVPGQSFDWSALKQDVAKGLSSVPQPAQQKIVAWQQGGLKAGDIKLENAWGYPLKTGAYGTDYIQRALITYIGLGANLPQDGVYPLTNNDADGKSLNGAHKYVMTFPKDRMPPVNGFWSVTMYNAQHFFYDNPLDRYTLSQRDPLKKNADGSVDLYFQHEQLEKGKVSNWLPAPEGHFVLVLRMYWPKEDPPSIIDGSWVVPPVTRVD